MRPRLFTFRNAFLVVLAGTIFGGLGFWIKAGMPLPGQGVPSTAGKLVWVSDRAGSPDLWMMDGATGENVQPLTSDAADDRSPQFHPSGNEVAFVSNRSGVSPQVFLMDAAPGRKAIRLTNTGSAKSDPSFHKDGHLVYLDAGKVLEQDVAAQDVHAVFPEPDSKNFLAEFLSTGGVSQAVPLAGEDGRYALVMNAEGGQALLYYKHSEENHADITITLVTKGEHITIVADKSGGCVAAVDGADPVPQPFVITSPEKMAMMVQTGDMRSPDAIQVRPQSGARGLVQFDANGTPVAGVPLTNQVDSLAVTPDGQALILASEDPKTPGVLYLPVATQGQPVPLFEKPARQLSISPDGKYVAFVSGKDVYVSEVQGNGQAKNLTGGKGNNSQPVWSPQVAGQKK
jgi:dipeptidyl aminopeptidase/acylaminoacyl peptidase